MAAVAGGNVAIVRKLLDHGAVLGNHTDDTLIVAVLGEHTALVELLCERFGPFSLQDTRDAVRAAAKNGLDSMVELLYEKVGPSSDFITDRTIREVKEQGLDSMVDLLESLATSGA